uniref:Putative conserved plasma membrane protein n=1 Tax=Ixodes ricinus TaxID=34613 RepID=A0A131XTN8_IXORI
MIDRHRNAMDDPDPMRMTDLEALLSTLGALFAVTGFFCVALGLSLPHVAVTVAGYVLAPIGLVVFLAFLFVYHSGRRGQRPSVNNRRRGEEVTNSNVQVDSVGSPMVPSTRQVPPTKSLAKRLCVECEQPKMVYETHL